MLSVLRDGRELVAKGKVHGRVEKTALKRGLKPRPSTLGGRKGERKGNRLDEKSGGLCFM